MKARIAHWDWLAILIFGVYYVIVGLLSMYIGESIADILAPSKQCKEPIPIHRIQP